MPALGLLILLGGAFLMNAAVRNKNPFTMLGDIVRSPTNVEASLRSKGTDYSTSATTGSGGTATTSGAAAAAIAYARAAIGKPYKRGGTGPDNYDCSGLAQAAYKAAGISLPRTTALQVMSGVAVLKKDIQPGDLIFPDPGHVQIATGSGYPTTIVEAPRSGEMVRERSTWGFWTARRVSGGS